MNSGDTGPNGQQQNGGNNLRELVRRLLNDVAESGRDLTEPERIQVQNHVAGAGFEPGPTTKVSRRLVGQSWLGHVFRPGDRAPTDVVHYLRHRDEWPAGTTLDDYLRSLRDAIRNRRSGILLEKVAGDWRLTIVAPTGPWRGEAGGNWMLIGYTINYGYWTTGYQPPRPFHETLDMRMGIEQARWLQRPS